MNRTILEELGLNVKETDGEVEVELELTSGQLVNPLTRQFLTKATFTIAGDRLLVIDPPELVGSPPILVQRIERAADIEQVLSDSLNEHIFQISRRSGELTALGLSPKVDPTTLQLTAEVRAAHFLFVIASDRMGNFRVARALRNGDEMTSSSVQAFELSEFRERSALEGYLAALFGEVVPPMVSAMGEPPPTPITDELPPMADIAETEAPPPPRPAAPVRRMSEATQPAGDSPYAKTEKKPALRRPADAVAFAEIVERFGGGSIVPPRSPMEILLELRVKGRLYRFAAARVEGRTFRGLLASRDGKLWAERFDLDEFPGVIPLVCRVLGVRKEEIELPEAR